MSPRTIERLRVAGTGPKFLKAGKSVRYREYILLLGSRQGLLVQHQKGRRDARS